MLKGDVLYDFDSRPAQSSPLEKGLELLFAICRFCDSPDVASHLLQRYRQEIQPGLDFPGELQVASVWFDLV